MKANVFMILAAGLLLGACSNDNEPTDNANGVAAVFTTNLDGRVQTRMADNQWAEDDAIGIFSLNDEMQGVMIDDVEQSNNAVNLKYTRSSNVWDGGTTAFRFKNPADATVTFRAYYPYTADADITDGAGGKKEGTIAFEATDQSLAGQVKFDFLFADKDGEGKESAGSKNSPNVNFQFAHSMTKIIIVLKADGSSVKDLGTMAPTLKGLKAKGTFSLANGVAALAGDAKVVDLLLSNQTETTNTDTQQSFVAIVPPQTASADVFLTIASGSDSYLSARILSKKELTAGNCYTVTVTVKKRELVVDSSDITPWAPGEDSNSDAILQ
jgi:hypothetical protein